MTVRIFVDFDGTITREDVGNAFFRHFGGERCDDSVRQYRAGALSAMQCFTQEAEAMGSFDVEEAVAFVRSFRIDDTFGALVAFARERGYPLTVVSDGLDFYIREILTAQGMEDVRFISNHTDLIPAGNTNRSFLKVEFPFSDAECTRCACCKRNLMITRSADEDVIVLIGEGYSDMCPARYADIVFAKSDLQAFCQRENVSYFPYTDFDDVVTRLTEMTLHGKGLRKRARAELLRRAAFREE